MHLESFTLAPALWGALILSVAYAAGFLAGQGNGNRPMPPAVLAR